MPFVDAEGRKKYVRGWRAANADKVNKDARDRYARDGGTWDSWKRRTLAKLKSRSKSDGRDFDLTLDDLCPPPLCPVFGTPFELGVKKRNHQIHALRA